MYRKLILLLLVFFVWVPPALGVGHPASCNSGPFAVPGLSSATNIIGEWGSVLAWAERATHAALLHTGKVIWWRGIGTPTGSGPTETYLWDPSTDTTTELTDSANDLFCSGHGVLADGRLITIGGTLTGSTGIKDTHIFDPVTETWSRVADMHLARWYPTATILSDGRVLAHGGQIGPGVPSTIPEIYDVATDTWTQLTGINDADMTLYPTNFLLPDGLIFFSGPNTQTELIDLDTETQTNSAISSTSGEESSVVMYRPGQVLKTGGGDPAIDTAEIIDMAASIPIFSSIRSLNWPRRRHDSVLLPDGNVLIVGGSIETQSFGECAVHSAELWDPDTGVFTEMASMATPRIYHSSSILLPDGRVLVAGGEWAFNSAGVKSAEVYSPPYLFKGTRPVISTAPSVVSYDKAFRVNTPDAASIVSVSFVRSGSFTHNFNQNQRYIPLDFKQYCTYLAVYPPKTSNIAPPGYYMLFLVDDNGVPSIAEFVRLSDSGGATVIDTGFDVCSY